MSKTNKKFEQWYKDSPFENNMKHKLQKAYEARDKEIEQLKADKQELIEGIYELNSIPPMKCNRLLNCWIKIFNMIDRMKCN